MTATSQPRALYERSTAPGGVTCAFGDEPRSCCPRWPATAGTPALPGKTFRRGTSGPHSGNVPRGGGGAGGGGQRGRKKVKPKVALVDRLNPGKETLRGDFCVRTLGGQI